MKPKTKLQKEVDRLSTQLPELTEKQKLWAYTHCFEKIGHLCKGFVWCSECGLEFKYDKTSDLSIEIIGDKHKCPYCGAILDIKNSRKTQMREKAYFTIISIVGKYQLCRHFLASKCVKKGNHPGYDINECVQNWLSPDGKETIRARIRNAFTYYVDSWVFSKPMEIRPDSGHESAYQIHAEAIYPYQGVTKLLRRNGYTAKCDVVPPSALFKMLLKDNIAEMLIKTRQYSLLKLKYVRGHLNDKYLHSIRIANRNGYIIKDASMWIDYLELLEYFRLDTHNAHYVCPKNLKAEHDRLSIRKRKAELRKETKRKLKEAAKWENLYRENMGKFFGICFGNQEIIISVITSVSDMAAEGEAMHHCVFTSGYYKRPDSLILSARSITGQRLETVEVSIKTLKIVQSRAHCNTSGPKHAEILELVNKNMNLIKQAI